MIHRIYDARRVGFRLRCRLIQIEGIVKPARANIGLRSRLIRYDTVFNHTGVTIDPNTKSTIAARYGFTD